MRVLTTGRTSAVAVMLLISAGTVAGAQGLPLPERNPLRESGALPLPERNPQRDTLASADGFILPERNPTRDSVGDTGDFNLPERNPMRETIADADDLNLPKRNPLRAASLTLPERNPARLEPDDGGDDEEELKPDPNKWSDEEIAAERANCAEILNGLAAVTEPVEPIRQNECGAPAPIKLVAIGQNPQVKISPPSTVTCAMAAAMVRWFERDVQPAARKFLAGPVTRINIIGHYSCRNALGRITTRLSEHGVANALDIKDFVIEGGQVADLKRDWGPNSRDIAARIAAEKAAEAARKAAAAAAEIAAKVAKEAKETAPKVAKATQDEANRKAAMGLGADRLQDKQIAGSAGATASGRKLTRAEIREAKREARRMADAGRIKGKAGAAGQGATIVQSGPASAKKTASAVDESETSPRRQFLRQIHAKACGTFGTVLGPEANEAHRDHFHLDMAKRRHRSYCE